MHSLKEEAVLSILFNDSNSQGNFLDIELYDSVENFIVIVRPTQHD